MPARPSATSREAHKRQRDRARRESARRSTGADDRNVPATTAGDAAEADDQQPVRIAIPFHLIAALLLSGGQLNDGSGNDSMPPNAALVHGNIDMLLSYLAFRTLNPAFGLRTGVTAHDIARHTQQRRCPLSVRGENCAVCFAAFDGRNTVRSLRCGHHYHPKCIDRWLQEETACPLCRAAVVPPEGDEGAAAA